MRPMEASLDPSDCGVSFGSKVPVACIIFGDVWEKATAANKGRYKSRAKLIPIGELYHLTAGRGCELDVVKRRGFASIGRTFDADLVPGAERHVVDDAKG